MGSQNIFQVIFFMETMYIHIHQIIQIVSLYLC